MNKDYYKEYFLLERTHWWFKIRERILSSQLERFLSGNKRLKILNVGSATGRSSEMLERFGEVSSMEFDKDCFEFVLNNMRTPIIHGSVLDIPFESESFDLVCAFDVIEHVEDDKLAIAEMNRVCKEGGILFITVPAFMSLWSKHDEVNHHFRRYTMKQLLALFENDSYNNVIFKSYFNSFLFFPIWIVRIIGRIAPGILKRSGAGSDFAIGNSKFADKFFSGIFSLEIPLLKKINFPFGISILFLWRK